jgi:hypothetical protein
MHPALPALLHCTQPPRCLAYASMSRLPAASRRLLSSRGSAPHPKHARAAAAAAPPRSQPPLAAPPRRFFFCAPGAPPAQRRPRTRRRPLLFAPGPGPMHAAHTKTRLNFRSRLLAPSPALLPLPRRPQDGRAPTPAPPAHVPVLFVSNASAAFLPPRHSFKGHPPPQTARPMGPTSAPAPAPAAPQAGQAPEPIDRI